MDSTTEGNKFSAKFGSVIEFDKGYVAYEQFTNQGVWSVTKLKSNTLYKTNNSDYQNSITGAYI